MAAMNQEGYVHPSTATHKHILFDAFTQQQATSVSERERAARRRPDVFDRSTNGPSATAHACEQIARRSGCEWSGAAAGGCRMAPTSCGAMERVSAPRPYVLSASPPGSQPKHAFATSTSIAVSTRRRRVRAARLCRARGRRRARPSRPASPSAARPGRPRPAPRRPRAARRGSRASRRRNLFSRDHTSRRRRSTGTGGRASCGRWPSSNASAIRPTSRGSALV